MKLTYLGAAQEVTGSRMLLQAAGTNFLVDCGMFQGGADAYRKNRTDLGPAARHIDFVLLTHAHIDHSGLLPCLFARGFRGPIYATRATCDLLEIMLPDAAFVQEREAAHEHGRSAHRPLYTVEEARATLKLLKPVEYDERVTLSPRLSCRFRDAGHILGSAIIELWCAEDGRTLKVVFSGDLGHAGSPVVHDPTPIRDADAVIVESTYGNRLHKSLEQTEAELVEVISSTRRAGGNVIVPAFAVGRTQELLHVLADLVDKGRVAPGLDVYVDSPMATKATAVTLRHRDLIDDTTNRLMSRSRDDHRSMRVHFTESVEESRALNHVRHGAIIISASGMCDAGRIKYHLKHNLRRAESSIVFTGFQAAGTLGRRLVDGATSARIFGDEVPVRARIRTIGGLSAHADQAGLLSWLKRFETCPTQAYVVHGEAATALAFADLMRKQLGWRVEVPCRGETFELSGRHVSSDAEFDSGQATDTMPAPL